MRCVHSNVWIRNLGSMCTSTNTHSYTHEHAHTSNGSRMMLYKVFIDVGINSCWVFFIISAENVIEFYHSYFESNMYVVLLFAYANFLSFFFAGKPWPDEAAVGEVYLFFLFLLSFPICFLFLFIYLFTLFGDVTPREKK